MESSDGVHPRAFPLAETNCVYTHTHTLFFFFFFLSSSFSSFFCFVRRRRRRRRRRRSRSRRRLRECSELTREHSEREVEAINLRHVSEFRAWNQSVLHRGFVSLSLMRERYRYVAPCTRRCARDWHVAPLCEPLPTDFHRVTIIRLSVSQLL